MLCFLLRLLLLSKLRLKIVLYQALNEIMAKMFHYSNRYNNYQTLDDQNQQV